MLPQIALGQSQSSILANAYFENDILDLVNVFIPPMASNTMSADVLNRIGNEKAGNGENKTTQRDLGFDILPYAICYCKVANTPLDKTFETSATQVLTVVTYELQRIEEENRKLKQKAV